MGVNAVSFTLYQIGMMPGLPDRMVFEQENITVGALFHFLSGKYGETILKEIMDKEGDLSEDVMFVLNGSIIKPSEILPVVIPPGGELLISALIAGG